MTTETISRQQALELINQVKAQSRVYSVKYLKKDGSVRKAQCHPTCAKYLKGGAATYNANNAGNIWYHDLGVKGSRCFNINRVLELTVNKQHYIVQE